MGAPTELEYSDHDTARCVLWILFSVAILVINVKNKGLDTVDTIFFIIACRLDNEPVHHMNRDISPTKAFFLAKLLNAIKSSRPKKNTSATVVNEEALEFSRIEFHEQITFFNEALSKVFFQQHLGSLSH
jgi:hypothetical protein